jgi:hypothetical protein
MVKKSGESTKEHKARLMRERDDITLKIIQHRHEGNSVTDTCRLLNITRPTYFKYLREKGYGDFGKDNLYTRYVAKPTPVGSLFLTNASTVHCNERVLENRGGEGEVGVGVALVRESERVLVRVVVKVMKQMKLMKKTK